MGVNKIIALGHSGFTVDKNIAQKVKGVDVVIGGHTNTFLYTGILLPTKILLLKLSWNCLSLNSENFHQYSLLLAALGQVHSWYTSVTSVEETNPKQTVHTRYCDSLSGSMMLDVPRGLYKVGKRNKSSNTGKLLLNILCLFQAHIYRGVN